MSPWLGTSYLGVSRGNKLTMQPAHFSCSLLTVLCREFPSDLRLIMRTRIRLLCFNVLLVRMVRGKFGYRQRIKVKNLQKIATRKIV